MSSLYADLEAPELRSEEAERAGARRRALEAGEARAQLARAEAARESAEASVRVLERNVSALFSTARLELARKDAEIEKLRALLARERAACFATQEATRRFLADLARVGGALRDAVEAGFAFGGGGGAAAGAGAVRDALSELRNCRWRFLRRHCRRRRRRRRCRRRRRRRCRHHQRPSAKLTAGAMASTGAAVAIEGGMASTGAVATEGGTATAVASATLGDARARARETVAAATAATLTAAATAGTLTASVSASTSAAASASATASAAAGATTRGAAGEPPIS